MVREKETLKTMGEKRKMKYAFLTSAFILEDDGKI
jgi:hypothetical protein